MSSLHRLLRDARLDDPDSLRALAEALAREGFDDGVLQQFELTWWSPSGVVLRPAVVFEGGRAAQRFRVRVRETLGYHLHVAPDESWAEAELVLTTDARWLLRTKALPQRRRIHNEAALYGDEGAVRDALAATRARVDHAVEPDEANLHALLSEAMAGAMAWAMRIE